MEAKTVSSIVTNTWVLGMCLVRWKSNEYEIWHLEEYGYLEEYEHRDDRVFAFLFLVVSYGSSTVVGLSDKFLPSLGC